MIPLILRLKKKAHKDIAGAHDLLVEEIYNSFNDAVLHGGTAIWRCYKGNRFSEDVDVYLNRDLNRLELLFENLKKKGFIIEKKKISKNSLFSNLRLDRTIIRLEAIFKKADGILSEYETVEGNFITVYTLTPEELINEKINAYLNRYRVRDLYDIFFLLRHIKDRSNIKNRLRNLLKGFKKPIDELELKVLILEGLIPNSDKMVQYIERFIKRDG